MKTLIVIAVFITLAISQAAVSTSPTSSGRRCPSQCRCQPNQNVCSSCKDTSFSVFTNCTTCRDGYKMVANQCYLATSSCPPKCTCTGFDGKQCGVCKDPNAAGVNCTSCMSGFHLDANANMCLSNNCPSQCQCGGSVRWVCTKCNDPKTSVENNCLSPMDGCPSACVCGAKPGQCVSCVDPFMTIGTSCTRCLTGYIIRAGVCIPDGKTPSGCPSYCVCKGINPGACTGCSDIHMTLASMCTRCEDNYTIVSGQCTWNNPSCPEGCYCNPFPPYCVRCKLPNFSTDSNCTQCSAGYSSVTSNMYGTKECQIACLSVKCNCSEPRTCLSCKDNLADVTTTCSTCLPPYRMNPSTGNCGL